MSEGKVSGRSFTGYRIGGAIAALLLLVALGLQTLFLFSGRDVTRPETGWRAVAVDGQSVAEPGFGSPVIADEILTGRTQLLRPRTVSGPSPGEAPGRSTKGTAQLVETPLPDDEAILTDSWRIPSDSAARILRSSGHVEGISSLPYVNAAVFERPEARDWRIAMADVITHFGAYMILGAAFLLALMLALRGRVPIHSGMSGRTVKRFGFIERANHWMTATSFLGLAFTGVAIGYGDTLIRPFGDRLVGTVGWFATWGHAIFVPSFILGLLVMLALWTHRNLPSRLDLQWLRRAGGFFSESGDTPPARKFNAGQKIVFWSAILGGAVMIVSGLTLMFPFFWADTGTMSWAMLIHAAAAALLIAIFLGHIYIGTVGMQGAIWAMWGGDVDRNWAAEHHSLWLEEIEGTEAGR